MSNPNDPVLKEYAHLAARYDERWSFYVESTIRETLERLDVGPDDCLLDVGCGTGALLLALSQSLPQLDMTGIDPSPEMLAVARTKLRSNVVLVEGRAECLPFPDGKFTLVVSTNVFHFLRQPKQVLAEMARVLKPNGRLMITDWCDDYLACKICDWYLRLFNRSHFRMYGMNSCRKLLVASEFEDIDIERYKINWLWGLMTARARRIATTHQGGCGPRGNQPLEKHFLN